jgi:hypothetical protein
MVELIAVIAVQNPGPVKKIMHRAVDCNDVRPHPPVVPTGVGGQEEARQGHPVSPVPPVDLDHVEAVLFDLDGVLTATAKFPAACWKQAFDEFLQRRAAKNQATFRPFDIKTDYEDYVDGKPRYDGVRSFLKSRGIELPQGNPEDPPDREGGKTILATLKPTTLLSMFNAPQLKGVAKEVEDTIVKIMKEAASS